MCCLFRGCHYPADRHKNDEHCQCRVFDRVICFDDAVGGMGDVSSYTVMVRISGCFARNPRHMVFEWRHAGHMERRRCLYSCRRFLLCGANRSWRVRHSQDRFADHLYALQFFCCALAAMWPALAMEGVTFAAISDSWFQLVYTALLASALGFSLQFIAQQHTPSSDTAIILSSEAVFAAIAGSLILGEHLTGYGWTGCALIAAAILLVELAPLLRRKVPL